MAPPRRADALLGRFHPVVAERLRRTLEHRGVLHRVVTRDDDVEIHVDRDQQADLRAELALTWAQVVHALPADDVVTVLGLGGASPGWYDAPQGGWVDRAGRFVVEAEGDGTDGPRMAGPAVAAAGAVVLLLAWYAGASAGVIVAGGALLLVGLLIPR
ncbi:MAG: hypothetical protein WEB03_16755 [Nitriliruptor sp.]|uniref:hypothetical protein n=1 Tax=Nitriliruptor sp. TaxID=2448056 RepID=UPI0034A05423